MTQKLIIRMAENNHIKQSWSKLIFQVLRKEKIKMRIM